MTEIVDLWVEALREVGQLERAQRRAELTRENYPRRDGHGLHALSVAWGRVKALQALDPVLEEQILTPHVLDVRDACRDDVDAEWDDEQRERWRVREQLAKRSVTA